MSLHMTLVPFISTGISSLFIFEFDIKEDNYCGILFSSKSCHLLISSTSAFWWRLNQWCVDILAFWKKKSQNPQIPCFAVFANFHCVNTSIKADYKLLTWHHWMWSWREIYKIGFCGLDRAHSSTTGPLNGLLQPVASSEVDMCWVWPWHCLACGWSRGLNGLSTNPCIHGEAEL